MGSFWYTYKFKLNCFFIVVLLCIFIPSFVWSAGFQEEKLFDSEFYSPQELRTMIEQHNQEIRILDDKILSLKKEIDWVILRINQVEDSGRTATSNQKASISRKEKQIQSLQKSRNRLESLVKYYSSMLGRANKAADLEEIYNKKTSSPELKKTPVLQKKKATGKRHAPATASAPPLVQKKILSVKTGSKRYGRISKAELQLAIDRSGIGDWIEIVGTGTCLKLETTLPILFATGSAKIADEYKSFFNTLAEFIKPYDVKVLVTGYTDKIPIKNTTYPSNFELGATRAANIVHLFVSNGLKPAIFKIESTGSNRFAAKQISKQKALERRAEVTVIFSG